MSSGGGAQTLPTGSTTTVEFTYCFDTDQLCEYFLQSMNQELIAGNPAATEDTCYHYLNAAGCPDMQTYKDCRNQPYFNPYSLGFYPYNAATDQIVGAATQFSCSDCTPAAQLNPAGGSIIGTVQVPAGTSDVFGYLQASTFIPVTIPAAWWTTQSGQYYGAGGLSNPPNQYLIFATGWVEGLDPAYQWIPVVGFAIVQILSDAICCGPPPGHQPPTIPGGPGALGAESGVDLLNAHPAGFYIGSATIAVAHHSDWLVFETVQPAIGQNIRLARFPPGGGIDMTWYYPNAQDLDPLGNPTGPYNLFRFRSYDFGQTWVAQPPMQDGYYTPFLPGVKWARNLYLEQVQRYALCYNDTSGQDTYGYPDGTGLIQFVSWDQQGTQYGPFQVCQDVAANGAIGCIEVPYPTRHLRACFQDNNSLMLRHFVSGDDGATWQEWTAIPPIKGGSPALCFNERSGELLILYCSWDGQKPDPPPTNGTSYVRIIDVTGKDLGNFPDDDYGLGPGLTAFGTALIWTDDRTDHLLAFGVSGPSGASESGPIPLCQSFDGGRTWNMVSPTT